MAIAHRLDPTRLGPRQGASEGRQWTWVQWLALTAVPILIWEAWTLTAWIADGPRQITKFQDRDSVNWYAVQVVQVGALLVALGVGSWVVRGCLRERRLTFDAMFCLAGLTVFWADCAPNFFQPCFVYSSNFINLNSPMGHLPGVVNPDAGRTPDPIPFTLVFESFALLLLALGMGVVAKRIRARCPGISNLRLFWTLIGLGILFDIALELPLVALGVWTYTSPASWSIGLGNGLRFPWTEAVAATFYFVLCCSIRVFKDDRGRTIVERGLEHLSPVKRTGMSLLALYSAFQLITWGPGLIPDLIYGPYQTGWPKLAPYLVNDQCDAPGVTGTRYGPCPGSPDFRMPGRTTVLSGEAP